jgi:class 3 adenylate cyclase
MATSQRRMRSASRVKAQPLPTGTVTFAFTDIEGSTARWERDRVAMRDAVRRHDAILRAAITEQGGSVFKTIGDAFCSAFARPHDAVEAMLAAQLKLAAEDFSAVDGLRVRAAIHIGTADERDGDYFGTEVNRVSRLLVIGHGGQILLTSETAALCHPSPFDKLRVTSLTATRSG